MSDRTGALSLREVFGRDAARFDEAFRKAGAIYTVHTEDDGDWQLIDKAKVCPELVSTYQRFIQFGYANGLMP